MKDTVLLVEDEKLMRVTLEDALTSAGYDVVSYEKGEEALKAFREKPFDIVITDVRLPDIDGLDILREVRQEKDSQVLVITAFGTIRDAVEAMKLGAFDYITKPFSLDQFLLLIQRALEIKRLRKENVRLKRDLKQCYGFPNIVGDSEEMQEVFSLIEKVSESDSTVLIYGESGTGKELIASTIHYRSKRRDNSLVKVNCAALPETLIESELFGHEKGSFTGAHRRKPGRFELADKGTLFLDEIRDLPPASQIKLLRVLQDGTFERLGGTESLQVDARIIAATNRNLFEEVKKGVFREDLYYRLNVIPLHVPPLKERGGDIPLLIEYFLEKHNKRFEQKVKFSSSAVDTLMTYDFPGNVRELENVLERCATLSEGGTVYKEDLPSYVLKKDQKGFSPGFTLSQVAVNAEREYILKVLRVTKGNKTRAAKMLNISRKTLWEKMNAYGMK